MNKFIVQKDFAAIWLVDAGDHLDQRGFSRAILAQQCMYLTGTKPKGDPMQDLHPSEALGNIL
jgi:hypothetical protein